MYVRIVSAETRGHLWPSSALRGSNVERALSVCLVGIHITRIRECRPVTQVDVTPPTIGPLSLTGPRLSCARPFTQRIELHGEAVSFQVNRKQTKREASLLIKYNRALE